MTGLGAMSIATHYYTLLHIIQIITRDKNLLHVCYIYYTYENV